MFIGHIPTPHDIDINRLKTNFDLFFDCVDYVYEYTLLGDVSPVSMRLPALNPGHLIHKLPLHSPHYQSKKGYQIIIGFTFLTHLKGRYLNRSFQTYAIVTRGNQGNSALYVSTIYPIWGISLFVLK